MMGSTIYYEYGRIGATCTKGQKVRNTRILRQIDQLQNQKGYIEAHAQ